MAEMVIETSGLRKQYGPKLAVADLTLQVPRGEVFGFLGPNGAGKSTSVKMLLGLVTPSKGSASVLGRPPAHPAAMARIGFLPEHFRFHEWLHADELLDLHGRLYGMDRSSRRRRIAEVLEQVGLAENAHRQLAGFSKGMLQRIGLAQAMLNRPDLIILDEPTSALDPFGRMLVRRIIHDLKDQGTTVFLNSHLLGEVEATCDRVSFIKEGRVVSMLSLHELDAAELQVSVSVEGWTPELAAQIGSLPGLVIASASSVDVLPDAHVARNGAAVADTTRTTIDLLVAESEQVPVIAERIIASGARLYSLTPRHVSLEERFLEIMGREDSGQ